MELNELINKPVDTVNRTTTRSVTEEEVAARPAEPTFMEGAKAAFALEQTVGVTLHNMESAGYTADPEFRATEEHMSRWTKDLDPKYHTSFLDAMSEEHGNAIRREIDGGLKDEETLGRMGWGGVGLRLAAAMSDPVAWGAMIATEGAAAPWVFANKASRLSKAVRGALVAGGSNAALESYLYSQSYTKEAGDILWAGALGAGLGAAVTPFMRHAQMDETRKVADLMGPPKPADEVVDGVAPAAAPIRDPFAEFTAVRHQAKESFDQLEATQRQAQRLYDEVGDMTDQITMREAGIQWLHQIERGIVRVDGEPSPVLGDIDLEDIPTYLADALDEEDIGKLKELILELGDGGDIAKVRKELRATTKQMILDKQQVQKKIDSISSHEQGHRAKYAALKKREDALNEELNFTGPVAPKSMGAAQVDQGGTDIDLKNTDDIDSMLENMDVPTQSQGVLSRMRFDMVGRLLNSDSPHIRSLAGRLAEDGMGRADHAVAGQTASEVATHIRELAEYNVYKVSEPAFRQWVHDKGGNWLSHWNTTRRREFFVEVSDYIDDTGGVPHASVKATGDAMRKEFMDYLQAGKDAKLKGFDKIPADKNYLPRLANKAAVRQLHAEFTDTEIINLIRGAILKAVPDMDALKKTMGGASYSERVARGYWRKMMSLERGLDTDFAGMISTDSRSLIRQIMDEDGVDADTIENIEFALEKINSTKNSGKHSRAKHRLDLDAGHFAMLKPREAGMAARKVHISDLFERDAEKLFSIYGRQMSGQIALGKQGFRSKADFQRWIDAAKANAIDSVKVAKEAKLAQFLYDGVAGVPLEHDPAGWLSSAGRVVRDWNFVRIMNQVGFAQVAEIGNMIGAVGWKAVLTHIPEVRAAMKRLKNGELEDGLSSQLEAVWAIGTQRLRNQVSTRYDEYGEGMSGKFMQKYDNAMQRAKRITSDISLMAPVNMLLHRTALKAVIQNLTDSAAGLSKISPKRLASIGISQEMMPRIQKLLLDNTKRTDSLFGANRKIKSLDIDGMLKSDPEATDILIHGVNRWVKRVIQENDIGATHEWMHSTLGKILFQFRSFMMVAWPKQTLHNLHMADMQSFAMFTYSMMFGGLAYSTQTAINSIGREDASEHLRERLSPQAVALAAFQRAGASSLIPAAMDSIWTTGFSDKPIFAYGRSTGLASDFLLGNPTVDLSQKIAGTVGIMKNIGNDHVMSQKNVRDGFGLAWFSNAMVVRNISQLMMQGLPDKSTTQ